MGMLREEISVGKDGMRMVVGWFDSVFFVHGRYCCINNEFRDYIISEMKDLAPLTRYDLLPPNPLPKASTV